MSAAGGRDHRGHGPGGLAGRLGIFARTFRRDTPGEVAAAVARAGYALGHWNFAAVGRATLAGDVDAALVGAVRRAFDRAGVGIPSVSATYNVIHPDAGLRAAQTAQAVRLIGLASDLGAEVVTLCSGTRDPDDIWRAHPRNLAEAVGLLGPSVIGVQAKDVVASGSAAAGAGLMDYPEVFRQLARLPPVPVIVQDAAEDDAARVRADLLRWHRQAGGGRDGGGRMPA